MTASQQTHTPGHLQGLTALADTPTTLEGQQTEQSLAQIAVDWSIRGADLSAMTGDLHVTAIPVANFVPQDLEVTEKYDPKRHIFSDVPEWSIGGPTPKLNRAQRRAAARQR